MSDILAEFIDSAAVKRRYGDRSDMALWRWENHPTLGFPKAIKIGRRKFWRVAELDAFDAARAAERERRGHCIKANPSGPQQRPRGA